MSDTSDAIEKFFNVLLFLVNSSHFVHFIDTLYIWATCGRRSKHLFAC